jgi:hypothetical protein
MCFELYRVQGERKYHGAMARRAILKAPCQVAERRVGCQKPAIGAVTWTCQAKAGRGAPRARYGARSGAGSVAIYGTDGVLQLNWTYTPEPPALLRGKVFEDEVVASWDHRQDGINFQTQHAVPPGWHPELAPVAGKRLKKAPRTKGKTGRPDILVDVDPRVPPSETISSTRTAHCWM